LDDHSCRSTDISVIYMFLYTFSQSSQHCSGTTSSQESVGEVMDSTLWSPALIPLPVNSCVH